MRLVTLSRDLHQFPGWQNTFEPQSGTCRFIKGSFRIFGHGRFCSLQGFYVRSKGSDLCCSKIVFPRFHSFCRIPVCNGSEDIAYGASMQPVFIGKVRAYKSATVGQMAGGTISNKQITPFIQAGCIVQIFNLIPYEGPAASLSCAW
jgi:hypothetical protein